MSVPSGSVRLVVSPVTLISSERNGFATSISMSAYSPEFRRRIAIAACKPGVSVSKLAREHGPNANLAFTWRHRYRAEQMASEATLLTVTVVNNMRSEVIAAPPIKPEIAKSRRTRWHD
ncbi:MAG: transposase [Burkholderia sp.]